MNRVLAVLLCCELSLLIWLAIFGFESSNSEVPNGRKDAVNVFRLGTDNPAFTRLFASQTDSVHNSTDKDPNFEKRLPTQVFATSILLSRGYSVALLIGLVVLAKGLARIRKIHRQVNSILHGVQGTDAATAIQFDRGHKPR